MKDKSDHLNKIDSLEDISSELKSMKSFDFLVSEIERKFMLDKAMLDPHGNLNCHAYLASREGARAVIFYITELREKTPKQFAEMRNQVNKGTGNVSAKMKK